MLQSGHCAWMAIDVDGDSDEVQALYCPACGTGIPRSVLPEPTAGAVTYTCPKCGLGAPSRARNAPEWNARTAPPDQALCVGVGSLWQEAEGMAPHRKFLVGLTF